MQKSSLRQNVLIAVGLYAVSFVVAAGCPASKETGSPESKSVPAVVPVAISPTTAPATAEVSGERKALPAVPPQAAAPPQKLDAPGESEPAAELLVAEATRPAAEHKTKPGKFDPIKANGQFFVDWPKPRLAILISGKQDGYLEPCGCAGLENQKGGMGRRFTLIEQLKENGWPIFGLDVGNLVRRFGKQAEIQFAISAEALKQMGYRAVAFGPDDLRLSAGELAAVVAGREPGESLFVSANASVFDLTPKVQIVEENGMKIGVTAILGDTYRQEVNNAEVELKPAAEAIREVVGKLEGCDVKILLAHATKDECAELAKEFPQFNFIVSAEGGDEPPYMAEAIEGTKAKLIEVGHKGMYCIVLGFYDDPKEPVRYQRVALDSRFATAPEMKQLMATYQGQLHDLGWSGLGLRPLAHPRTRSGVEGSGQFVGSETCADCHTKAWDVWSNSRHAHATDSLVHADPPRQFDAECISCHATGWNPQEYFPYATGYDSLKKTPHLAGNGCENCHGPGGAHVAAETADVGNREAERQLMRLTYAEAQAGACQKCHDLDNSPEFQKEGAFERYWAEIEHKGMD
jgi:hypothetical protein